jgi:ATP-dependent Clp protease ATP-binding subunit ClpA
MGHRECFPTDTIAEWRFFLQNEGFPGILPQTKTPPMQISRVTPGVQRILDRARQLAGQAGEAELLPEHLFQAMFSEESRGLELLEQFGINAESVTVNTKPTTNTESSDRSGIEPGPLAQQIFSAAGIQAARQGDTRNSAASIFCSGWSRWIRQSPTVCEARG